MENQSEVEKFLNDFKVKLEIFDIIFIDSREKNIQSLADLNIVPLERKKIISELSYKDYNKGPEVDHGFIEREIWVFGKKVKKKEVYIKISMGMENSPVICISFHISKSPLTYPFNKKT
jgi:hypothetical protein